LIFQNAALKISAVKSRIKRQKSKEEPIRFGNMKTFEELKARLEKLKPTLKEKFQVETIGIFGSYRRGEQTRKSDIDILVEFSANAQIGFFKFLDLEEFLSKKLGVKVDLVTKGALKPYIGERILQEVVMV
jgi:predicted nucleotidyltransferase